MRQAWVILKKDVRRLWWEILVTLGLLAALTRMDANRADYTPGSMEGLLNLLLPAAWMYLVALAVHQEALVGDRQFWITRPYPRPALVLAKVLFALAFIHLPSLLSDAAILSIHGFSPLAHLPSLLWKQALLAGVVTLSSAALASVTRNLTQFVLGAVVVAGIAIYVIGIEEPFSAPWISRDSVRWGAVVLLLALAACAIVLTQYMRRRTALSRTLGIGAVSTAALLVLYLPANYTAAVLCALSPQADRRPLSIELAPKGPGRLPVFRMRGRFAQLAIPVTIQGVPDGAQVRFTSLAFEIAGQNGHRWEAQSRPVGDGRNEAEVVFATLWAGEGKGGGWQVVRLDRSLYEKTGTRVTINATAMAMFYRERNAARVGIEAGANAVPGAGRCGSTRVEDRMGEEMLKVLCEAPETIPPTRVKLTERATGREWNQRLGDSMPDVRYAHETWLSPLNRRQTFFHLSEQRFTQPGAAWLVPRDALSRAELLVTPEQVTGRAIVSYQLGGVPLREFEVK